MDITGLKDKNLARFLELGWIHNVADIYQLVNYRQEIINLEKFGEKSFNNLSTMILKSKSNSLERLLFALGIRHIGEKTAEVLAKNFKTLDNLMKTKYQVLAAINDVGPVIATSIIDYFANQNNKKLIATLKRAKVNFSYLNKTNQEQQIFANMTFVITGALSRSRDYFANLLKNYGANVTNTVSKNTTYLLVGDEPGSKLDKAKMLDVKIISEEDLMQLIKNSN